MFCRQDFFITNIMSPKAAFPLLGLAIFARAELPDYPLTFGDMAVLAGYYTADGRYRGGRPEAAKQKRRGAYECLAYNVGPLGNKSLSANPPTA